MDSIKKVSIIRFFYFNSIFFLLILGVLSCSEKTKVEFRTESVSAELTISTFQGAIESAWKKDSSGTLYATTLTIDFTGTCSRTISSIIVKIDGTTSDTKTCSASGTFLWSHIFSSDATYALSFVPVLLGDGLPSTSGTITKNLTIDRVAPAAPVITTNGGANMVITTSSVTLNGTTSADTASLTTTDNGTLVFAIVSQTFQLDSTLILGQIKNISFTALDFAGNSSVPDTIQVSFNPSLLLAISESSGSGLSAPITDGGVRLTSVTTSAFLSATSLITSAPDGHKHFIGVTNVSANNQ